MGNFISKRHNRRRWNINYTNLYEYPDIDYLIQSIHEFQAHIVSNNQHYSNKIVVDGVFTKMRILVERVAHYYTIDPPKFENYYREPPPAFENINLESSSNNENDNQDDKKSKKIIKKYLEDEAYRKAMINYIVDGSNYLQSFVALR